MFHMIRAGRFKHRLLSTEFLHSEAMDRAIESVQKALPLWKSGRLSDWEWTALYIFILSAHRRPQDFLGGPHNESFAAHSQGALNLQQVAELFPFPVKALQKQTADQNFFALFCQRSLRSIPLSVQKSLALWQKENVLRLCGHIPSPEEVMKMQSLGIRCVSVLTDPGQMKSFVEEGRDVLGFVVHDLIHADHFFSDERQAHAQIQFSRHLEKLHLLGLIQNKLRSDIEFMGEWNYLISDMNSVPLHLFKTLKAILLASRKRALGIDFKSPLTGDDEESFRQEVQTIGEFFNFSDSQLQAWQRLNGPEFHMPEDALALEKVLYTN